MGVGAGDEIRRGEGEREEGRNEGEGRGWRGEEGTLRDGQFVVSCYLHNYGVLIEHLELCVWYMSLILLTQTLSWPWRLRDCNTK